MSIYDMLEAIAIFRRYVSLTGLIFHAEHDVLFGMSTREGVTVLDREKLKRLGWYEEEDCWAHNCSC